MVDQSRRLLINPLSRLWRETTAPMRALPSFIVVGVSICGTTSFYYNLTQHPQIKPSSVKEVHYFDRNFDQGINWYREHFPLRSSLRGQMITGEATPDYISIPLAAERLQQTHCDFQAILLLRDPVLRGYALYQKHVRQHNRHVFNGNQIIPYEQLVKAELRFLIENPITETVYRACIDDIETRRRAVQSGQPIPEVRYTSAPYLLRSLYAVQLKMWLQLFPRERLAIIKSEDYFADPWGVINQIVSQHLGLEPFTSSYVTAKNEGNKYPPLDPLLDAELRDYFRPHNQELYALMGRDLAW